MTTGLGVTFLLSVISPVLVAVINKRVADSNVRLLISIIVVALCVLIGQALDRTFSFPPTAEFWIIMLANFGAQQVSYNLGKDRVVTPIQDPATPNP